MAEKPTQNPGPGPASIARAVYAQMQTPLGWGCVTDTANRPYMLVSVVFGPENAEQFKIYCERMGPNVHAVEDHLVAPIREIVYSERLLPDDEMTPAAAAQKAARAAVVTAPFRGLNWVPVSAPVGGVPKLLYLVLVVLGHANAHAFHNALLELRPHMKPPTL